MPGTTPDSRLPLPKHWPRRVRSAVVHAISLAQASLAVARGCVSEEDRVHSRLQIEAGRLRQEIALLREEIRIKDARMEQIPAQRRPHYQPVERLAILELRAARAWSLSQTARRFQVTTVTIWAWSHRLDEAGSEALVRLRNPVNKFPQLVAYIVRRLKALCPTMGKTRIAQVLARAGLHLGPTTVRRMLQAPRRGPRPRAGETTRVVTARSPNGVWHVDLTPVPTGLGFSISWLPFALPQRWPFCWWVAVVVDHYSRRIMGTAVFRHVPSSQVMRAFLERAARRARSWPRHLITDQGRQFIAKAFRKWCRRHGIRQRFGAIGKHGSLAVIERVNRTLKSECARRLILVPLVLAAFERELAFYAVWYNGHRPHTWLDGKTPDEVYFGRRPACRSPRFETRSRWPRRARCAKPQTLVRGKPGVKVEIEVTYHAGRSHLPLVALKRAA